MKQPIGYLSSAAIAATLAMTTLALAEDNKPAPEGVLFVQHADKATLADTTLTLEGVDQNVVVFTDRPHRAAATIPVAKLVKSWGEGDDSFAADPPNAALVGETDDGKPVSLIVEITDPVLSDGAISYQYSVIKGDDLGAINNPYIVIDLSYLGFNVAGTIATIGDGLGIAEPAAGLDYEDTSD